MTERINEKLLANTPKGGKLGGDGILRHNAKEYVARSMDITGNKVIYEQIMNSKGTGNFKMMQGGRFVSTGKPVQVIEGINYKFGNFVYDPRVITIGTGALTIGVDMFNDSTVPETKTGIIFNTIKNLDDINKNMEMVWKKVRE